FWTSGSGLTNSGTGKADHTQERHTPSVIATTLMKQTLQTIVICCIASFALPALAAEQPITDAGTLDETSAKEAFPAKPPYSPYAGRNFPTRPFFGDTHLHTSFSMDAGAFGCRLTPQDAY